MNFLDELPKPFFILAPMDDVTDTVFRQIIADLPYPERLDGVQGATEQRNEPYMKYGERAAEAATKQSSKSTSGAAGSASRQAGAAHGYGPDLYFTEFVNVDGLQSPGRPRLMYKLQKTDKEKPIVAQLWGLNPENFYKTTQEIKEMGYDGVDLNMGCPVKTVIKNGACAALIKNRELTGEIIDAVRAGGGEHFPVSVKTRVGFNQVDLGWLEFLLEKKLDLLSIHGRTAKQKSEVSADWELIGKAREMRDSLCPATKIVGNGDVQSREQGLELAKKYKLDGIMIGRGVFNDPFVFSKESPWGEYTPQQKIELYRKHVELFIKTYHPEEPGHHRLDGVQGATEQRNEPYMKYGERAAEAATKQSSKSTSGAAGSASRQAGASMMSGRRIETLNKFCKIYVNGFDGAKELREKLMKAQTGYELLKLLNA